MTLRAFLIALILGSSVLGVHAQQDRVPLGDLIAEATQKNPEILASQKQYEAALQRPGREGSLPDPVFSPGYSSNGTPRPFAGLGTWQSSYAGLTLSQEVPFPGKRRLRGDIASKEAEADFYRHQSVKLNVISRLKQAYCRLRYAYAAIEVLTRNRDLLHRLRRRAEAPYFTGAAAQQAQVSLLETRILKMELEKRCREAEINSLLNRPPDAPLARPVDAEAPKLSWTLEDLFARARQDAPALRREQKMIERAEFAVGLARREYYPDYTVSAGYFNMGRMPDMYQFRVDLKLPVYWGRKQGSGAAEQVYGLDQERYQNEALTQALLFHIREEYLKAETSSQVMGMLEDVVIPQAETAAESYIAAYGSGAADFISAQMSLMTLLDSELSYHEERLSFHMALIRLEELTGLTFVN